MEKPVKRTKPGAKKTGSASPASAPRRRALDDAGSAAQPARADGFEEQVEVFDKAVSLFHAGRYDQAKELFERAGSGPAREVSHVARIHVRMCERRISRPAVTFSTAEDHYNYAVTLINRRELQAAERHLQDAVKLTPNADHIHYALALSRALHGDILRAYESLKRAIELDPRNRMQAHNDPDFAEFAHQQPIARLLFPGKEQRF